MTPTLASKPRPALLAFAHDEPSLATLREFASRQGVATSNIIKGGIDEAVAHLRSNPAPAALIIDVISAEEARSKLDQLAEVCDPETRVIVIGSVNEFSFYNWLMEIGIAGYLLKPLSAAALESAIKKPAASTANAPAAQHTHGKVTAVLGSRGGVGATTIAVNLAYALGHQFSHKTALMDFDPQLGTVAMAMDLEPTRGMRDAFEKPDRIDGIFLDRMLTKIDEHFFVFGLEEPLDEPVKLNPSSADAIIKLARGKFEHIIIDLPRTLDAFGRQTLKNADQVILVTELSLAGLRDAMRISDLFKNILKLPEPLIIANREGIAGDAEMTKGDFEKNLGKKLAFHIPAAAEAFASAATGEVLVETAAKCPATKVIKELSAHIAGKGAEEEAPGAKAPFFKMLLGDKKK